MYVGLFWLEIVWNSSKMFAGEALDFELQYCCGAYATKCARFSFRCVPQSRCQIEKIDGGAYVCDDRRLLFPPQYIAVTQMLGDFHRGQRLSLKGVVSERCTQSNF